MSKYKNTDGGNYRNTISVFACQSDTTHPKVLEMALGAGLISKYRYEVLTEDIKGHKHVLDNDELSAILEHYFGFYKGLYEEEEVLMQTTRFGKKVAGELRYMGEERMDLDWCSSGLATREAKEKVKFGSIVTMDNSGGTGELCLDDLFGNRN